MVISISVGSIGRVATRSLKAARVVASLPVFALCVVLPVIVRTASANTSVGTCARAQQNERQ